MCKTLDRHRCFLGNVLGNDFSVVGGFPLTLSFGGEDESQTFQLSIAHDAIGEGYESIELQIVTPAGQLEGVRPGAKQNTTIIIADDDCK